MEIGPPRRRMNDKGTRARARLRAGARARSSGEEKIISKIKARNGLMDGRDTLME